MSETLDELMFGPTRLNETALNEVKAWNAAHPVGTKVAHSFHPDRDVFYTRTTSAAVTRLKDGVAVVGIEGMVSPVPLHQVRVIEYDEVPDAAQLLVKAEAKIKELEAEVEAEEGAIRAAIEGMRAYLKGEREARFCTSDAVQDLLDQLLMQCFDHVPEYANFIRAAEEQHAATQGTIAELRSNLAGSLEERAALAHEVAEERAEVEHFKARAEKAEAKLASIGELVSSSGCICEDCDCAEQREPHAEACDPCWACRVAKVLES